MQQKLKPPDQYQQPDGSRPAWWRIVLGVGIGAGLVWVFSMFHLALFGQALSCLIVLVVMAIG